MNKVLDYTWACTEGGLHQRLEILHQNGCLCIKAKEIGADREQWFVKYDELDWVVFVEHISESVWLEPIGVTEIEKLSFFYTLLCSSKPE